MPTFTLIASSCRFSRSRGRTGFEANADFAHVERIGDNGEGAVREVPLSGNEKRSTERP